MHVGNLGNIYRALRQNDRAIEYYRQAIALAGTVGDRRNEGIHLGNLGTIYQVREEYTRAIAVFSHALGIAREIGYERLEGPCHGNIGDSLVGIGRFEEAEVAFREAIGICDENYPLAAGAFRGSLALLLAQRGNLNEAWVLLEIGESQIASHPEELAKFLCKRARSVTFRVTWRRPGHF